jgi:hypothetical protein
MGLVLLHGEKIAGHLVIFLVHVLTGKFYSEIFCTNKVTSVGDGAIII